MRFAGPSLIASGKSEQFAAKISRKVKHLYPTPRALSDNTGMKTRGIFIKFFILLGLPFCGLSAEPLAPQSAGDGTKQLTCGLSGRSVAFADSLRKRLLSQIVESDRYIIQVVRVRAVKVRDTVIEKSSRDLTDGVNVSIDPEALSNKIAITGAPSHGNLYAKCHDIPARFRVTILLQDKFSGKDVAIRDLVAMKIPGSFL